MFLQTLKLILLGSLYPINPVAVEALSSVLWVFPPIYLPHAASPGWQGWVDYKIFVVRYNYSYFKNM